MNGLKMLYFMCWQRVGGMFWCFNVIDCTVKSAAIDGGLITLYMFF